MVRFRLNREKGNRWDTIICPKIIAILAKNYVQAAKQIPTKSDDTHFQIKAANNHEQYTVDLSTKSCSCRQWDLTGIPCKHAVCALWCKEEDPEAYVNHYYTTKAYKNCYLRSVLPINGLDLWPNCEFPPLLPPVYKKNTAGRPAKLRRRECDEPPASSKTKLKGPRRQNKCKRCGCLGHNQRSSKDNTNTQQEAYSQQSSALSETSDFILNDDAQPTVRRPCTIGIQIGGASNTISTVNRSIIIQKPAFAKGGRNFTTLSILKSTSSDRIRKGESVSLPVANVSNLSSDRVYNRETTPEYFLQC